MCTVLVFDTFSVNIESLKNHPSFLTVLRFHKIGKNQDYFSERVVHYSEVNKVKCPKVF